MMNKIIFTVLTFVVSQLSAMADDMPRRSWQARLLGGLYLTDEPAWTLEPSVTWQFHKYVGVGFGMEFTSQYGQSSRQTMINGYEAVLTDNEKNVAWILFKPSLIIKSPDVWHTADNYYRLWFQAEPGISLGCPFHNSLTYEIRERRGNVIYTVDYMKFPNKDLHWFYWNARVSVNIAIDRFVLGAGYYISDLDYYSGRRNVTLPGGNKFYVPEKELSQNIFLSVGYSF